jgi:hypothetical protein
LFLDDDVERAREFLAEYPDAVWVQTVPECLEQLLDPWDEVHLDHDLGGEQFVEISREDCGMEVVRWLANEPRMHLRPTQFYVHSHNGVAAYFMVLQLKSLGFRVEGSPFGAGLWKPGARYVPTRRERILNWIKSLRRSKKPANE